MVFATGVDISVGWRFHAQLWRPMHGRVLELELDRFRWQKRDLRPKLALKKPSEGVPCCRIDSLVVGYDVNVLHPHKGERPPPSICVQLHAADATTARQGPQIPSRGGCAVELRARVLRVIAIIAISHRQHHPKTDTRTPFASKTFENTSRH